MNSTHPEPANAVHPGRRPSHWVCHGRARGVRASPACDAADSVDATAVAFLAWALGANATAAALQGEGLALLAAVSPAVQAANAGSTSLLMPTPGKPSCAMQSGLLFF